MVLVSHRAEREVDRELELEHRPEVAEARLSLYGWASERCADAGDPPRGYRRVVPTATFAVLFVFIVLRHERRRIEHFGVTAHPATAWVTVDPKSTSSPLVNAESVAQGDDLPLHGSPGPKPGRD